MIFAFPRACELTTRGIIKELPQVRTDTRRWAVRSAPWLLIFDILVVSERLGSIDP